MVMLLVVAGTQYSGMFDSFKQAELQLGGLLQVLGLFL